MAVQVVMELYHGSDISNIHHLCTPTGAGVMDVAAEEDDPIEDAGPARYHRARAGVVSRKAATEAPLGGASALINRQEEDSDGKVL